MPADQPSVHANGDFVTVSGRFYRAVDAAFEAQAPAGSTRAGRYSRPGQPTLYLSASPSGVAAAMIAHRSPDDQQRLLAFDVQAADIFDLRSPQALDAARREAGDPFNDWQSLIADGVEPPSWRVRDWIERQGAQGLIDPSRQAPGLWHLVLFRWNVPGGASVRWPSASAARTQKGRPERDALR